MFEKSIMVFVCGLVVVHCIGKSDLQSFQSKTSAVRESVVKKLQKRTAFLGQAAVRFGNFVLKSGKQFFMWTRGNKAINILLKEALPAGDKNGVPLFYKLGGADRALKDFNAAGLQGVGKEISDGVDVYYGWAGEVAVHLRMGKDIIELNVKKPATKKQTGKGFIIYYGPYSALR